MGNIKLIGNGWTGVWIALALLMVMADLKPRMDCFLRVVGACEDLARDYVNDPVE